MWLRTRGVSPLSEIRVAAMPYSLQRLAAGSYDLLLDGEVIGGIVRNVDPGEGATGWRVELLAEMPRSKRPAPFKRSEHVFRNLDAALRWLSIPTTAATAR